MGVGWGFGSGTPPVHWHRGHAVHAVGDDGALGGALRGAD